VSRDYYAVHCRMFTGKKYRALTDSARVTLFTLWAIAGDQEPEATWTDPEWLTELMQLHKRPVSDLRVLIDAGWLDTTGGGVVTIHDWDEHQRAYSERIAKDWQAFHKREYRNRKKNRAPKDTDTGRDTERDTDRRPDDVRTPSGHPPLESYDPTTWPAYWAPFFEAWKERGWSKITKAQREMLWEICRDWPTEACDWVRLAPDELKPNDVIAFLLSRHKDARNEKRGKAA
jgi:hypothetical protein